MINYTALNIVVGEIMFSIPIFVFCALRAISRD